MLLTRAPLQGSRSASSATRSSTPRAVRALVRQPRRGRRAGEESGRRRRDARVAEEDHGFMYQSELLRPRRAPLGSPLDGPQGRCVSEARGSPAGRRARDRDFATRRSPGSRRPATPTRSRALLPRCRGRRPRRFRRPAHVLVRDPNGIDGEFFYQKRAPQSRPAWIEVVTLRSRRGASRKKSSRATPQRSCGWPTSRAWNCTRIPCAPTISTTPTNCASIWIPCRASLGPDSTGRAGGARDAR